MGGKISLEKVPEEGREGLVADDDGKVVIIQHSGDEREGDAEGDDESISINLKAFPPKWNRAVIVVSVYGNTFKTVEDASITVNDTSRGEHLPHELIRMDLTLPKEIARTTLALSSVRSTVTPLLTLGSSLPVATRS